MELDSPVASLRLSLRWRERLVRLCGQRATRSCLEEALVAKAHTAPLGGRCAMNAPRPVWASMALEDRLRTLREARNTSMRLARRTRSPRQLAHHVRLARSSNRLLVCMLKALRVIDPSNAVWARGVRT